MWINKRLGHKKQKQHTVLDQNKPLPAAAFVWHRIVCVVSETNCGHLKSVDGWIGPAAWTLAEKCAYLRGTELLLLNNSGIEA